MVQYAFMAMAAVPHLFNLLQRPPPPAQLMPVHHNGNDTSRNGTALFVTAHPDDEAMFFAPTILGMQDLGWDVEGLCLSTGNASGIGSLRSEELYKSYAKLGVSQEHVQVINDPKLQDSLNDATLSWGSDVVANIVQHHLDSHPADIIITFDSQGVSNHHNHAILPAAVAKLVNRPRSFGLKSHPLPDKYTGPYAGMFASAQFTFNGLADVLVPAFKYFTGLGPAVPDSAFIPRVPKEYTSDGREHTFVNGFKGYFASVGAMRQHQSQMEWFRWGHLVASRYMWVNEIVELK